jgi:hypothetical protein
MAFLRFGRLRLKTRFVWKRFASALPTGTFNLSGFLTARICRLNGLAHLGRLQSIRIGQTKLRIDSIPEQQLADSLEVFAFYTGRMKENAEIRGKLDALGYQE